MRDSQVRLMERRRERNATLVARLKSAPQRLLITVLIGNTLVNLAIASYATVLAIKVFGSLGVGIVAGLSSIVILILGEIIPKSFAYAHRKTVSQFLALPLYVFYVLLKPIAVVVVLMDHFLKKRLNLQSPNPVTEEEIRIMAELGLESGAIAHDEQRMIEKVFHFNDMSVGSVMTPRVKFELLNGMVPVEQIAHFVAESGFSRFPVYRGNPNDIVGYVHTNDVMRILSSDKREELLINFALPVTRISESVMIDAAFRTMTKTRSHLHLVHAKNDPETIIGLVTMEDILEEIMGEIEDETDKRYAETLSNSEGRLGTKPDHS